MKIVVISDTHNDHNSLDLGEGDILIHCGDACVKGNYTEGKNFIFWFNKQNFKYKVFVAGNHDAKLKTHPELRELMDNLGIIYLDRSSTYINGLHIYGNNFTTGVRNGTYTRTLEERIKAWENMPDNIDILVTHIPPKYILDTNVQGEHCGCDKLLEAVQRRNIKVHVFGHIHEHMLETKLAYGTLFKNCSVKNRKYVLVGAPTLITEI